MEEEEKFKKIIDLINELKSECCILAIKFQEGGKHNFHIEAHDLSPLTYQAAGVDTLVKLKLMEKFK